jgi:hypothetical protein
MPRWTTEARAKQAALITDWQPWRASTGPRSADGKAKVSRNADQGGDAGRAQRLQRAQDDLAQAAAKVLMLAKRQRGPQGNRLERGRLDDSHHAGAGNVLGAHQSAD